MREILFKAKRKGTGEWIEGFYCKYGHTKKEKHYIVPSYASDLYAFEIDAETICQYTGLTDKNGNKIWENDVVRKTDTNPLGWGRVRTCTVSFDKLGYWLLTTEYGDGYWLGEFESEQLEVIDNIFDNAELLEGGATNE